MAIVLRVLLCGMCMLACVSFHIVFYLRGGPMARVSWNFEMYCLCILVCVFQFSCICGEPRTRVSWHWEGGKVGQCDRPQGGSAPIFRRTGLLYGFKCIYIKLFKV